MKMKRLLFVVLSAVIIGGLVLSGCAEPAPTPTPSSAPTTTQAPDKVTKLVFNNWGPPPEIGRSSQGFEDFANAFEELTGGRYEVEVIHGGALAGILESYDVVESGLADISMFIAQDVDKPFKMTDVISLPWTQIPCDIATKAWHEVKMAGYLDKEYSDVKLLYMFASASADDLFMIDPIESLADLQGVKIATGGGSRQDLLKGIGAVPVFAPPPEVYPMLQKGIVSGVLSSGYGLTISHYDEFVKYLIEPMRLFRVAQVVAMNLDLYNSMPDDIKQVVDDMAADPKYALTSADSYTKEYADILEGWLGTTGSIIQLNEEDTATLESVCAEIFENWIADREAEGWPAKEVVDLYYNSLKSLGVEKPALGYTP